MEQEFDQTEDSYNVTLLKDEEQVAKPIVNNIAGFLQRIIARMIDVIILAIPLMIAGFMFRNFAYTLGPWGRLVGFTASVLYWGYFHSEQKQGQTIGKKWLKIVVLDEQGHYLPLYKSFLREVILATIVLMNGWTIPLLQNPIGGLVATVIVFGGGLALFYGLVFNRTTRQGIHDLLVGSFVVSVPVQEDGTLPALPILHKRLTYGLLSIGVLLGVGALFVNSDEQFNSLPVLEASEWKEMEDVHAVLSENDNFFSVDVQRQDRNIIRSGGTTHLRDLNITVWDKTPCNQQSAYCEQLIRDIARIAFAEYDGLENLSGMKVTVVNRFEFGLANGQNAQGIQWSIEDWQAELNQKQ